MTSQTPSPLLVALLQTAESLPIFLLALPAGALADIVNRRRLLLFTQIWLCIAATALGALTVLELTTPTVLLVFAFLVGIATALNVPAWQAITQELVPREQLSAAATLGAVGFNIARPSDRRLTRRGHRSGTGLSSQCCLIPRGHRCALPLEPTSASRGRPGRTDAYGDAPGMRYARHAPIFQAVVIRTTAFIFFGSALWALLPSLARRELELSSVGYGLMLGCLGSGAIAGALTTTASSQGFPGSRHRNRCNVGVGDNDGSRRMGANRTGDLWTSPLRRHGLDQFGCDFQRIRTNRRACVGARPFARGLHVGVSRRHGSRQRRRGVSSRIILRLNGRLPLPRWAWRWRSHRLSGFRCPRMKDQIYHLPHSAWSGHHSGTSCRAWTCSGDGGIPRRSQSSCGICDGS